MEIKEYQAVIEAVLFASGEPVSVDRLAEILELDKPTVLKLAQSLQERLEQKDSGVCLLRIDNQFQMASKPEYGDIIRKVMDMRRNVPLSPAAMEVLSIVAITSR